MNKSKTKSFSIKSYVLALVLSWLSFFAFEFIISLVFSEIAHFENLYHIAKYVSVIVFSLIIMIFNKLFLSADLISCLILSGVSAVFMFGISLILGGKNERLVIYIIQMLAIIILPTVFNLIFELLLSKRKPKNKFKFKKR